MEPEFLDLIKTFEKAAKRLATLDSTILNFKDVVEGLRQNLDELVEMVQLEEIVELSEKGSQKIQSLHQELDQVSSAYERLLEVEQVKENYGHRLGLMEEKISELSECLNQTLTSQYANSQQVSHLALETHQFIYYKDLQTGNLMIQPKNESTDVITIEEVTVKKLVAESGMVFALDEQTGEVITLNGDEIMCRYELNATDFLVIGYNLYYLSEQQLMVFNLLTSQKRLIQDEVISFERLINQLICYTVDKTVTFISLDH